MQDISRKRVDVMFNICKARKQNKRADSRPEAPRDREIGFRNGYVLSKRAAKGLSHCYSISNMERPYKFPQFARSISSEAFVISTGLFKGLTESRIIMLQLQLHRRFRRNVLFPWVRV